MAKRIILAAVSLAVVVLIVVTAVLWLGGRGGGNGFGGVINSFHILGNARGFTVSVGAGKEFPTGDKPTVETMEAELDQMVAFARESGMNTIYFQVSDDGEAYFRSKILEPAGVITAEDGLFSKFDPLAYLCKAANEQNIQIFAVLDAFSSDGPVGDPADEENRRQTGGAAAELVKGYPIAGVILDGLDAAADEETMAAAITAVAEEMKKTATGRTLGLYFDGVESQGITPALMTRLTGDGTVDLVVPRLAAAVEAGEESYQSFMEQWLEAVAGEAKFYTGNAVYRSGGNRENPVPYEDELELSYQLFLNTVTYGVSGSVLEGYSGLTEDLDRARVLASFLSAKEAQNPLKDQMLSYPQTLAVTYPADGFRTTGRSIYMMGTSDPGEELTMDGKPLERISFGGTFGVKVDLSMGSNTFTFRQGDRTETVTIVRYTPSTTPAPITGITKSSIYPQVSLGVDANETITFSCVGPSGGRITATLDGKSVELTQAAAATQGVPTTFQGKLTLRTEDYPANVTTNIGKTTYLLSYAGANTTYTSAGETFVAGRDVQLQVRMTMPLSNVLEKYDDDESVCGTLKENAVLNVVGKEKTARDGVGTIAYQLLNGNYILGNNLEIVVGEPVPRALVTSIGTQLIDEGEILYLTGDNPGVTVTREERSLILDFLSTEIKLEQDSLTSALFDSVDAADTQFGARLTLHLKEEVSLWGYNVEYGEEGLRLYLKRAPTRSATFGKPLEGITVMLDPGHGGADPGALGMAYETGADEADLNLAVSAVVKYRLEQMGATVVMTRTDDLTSDTKFTIIQRNLLADEIKPDIFLSLHHNSAALTSDLSHARWMEAYYFEEESIPFAARLMDRLGPALGRETTDPAWDRFYVTRLTFAPAVLLEIGFMVNPVNYEECSDPLTIYKTACGIAQSILDMIPPAE